MCSVAQGSRRREGSLCFGRHFSLASLCPGPPRANSKSHCTVASFYSSLSLSLSLSVSQPIPCICPVCPFPDCPKYEVVSSNNNYEVRMYNNSEWARTEITNREFCTASSTPPSRKSRLRCSDLGCSPVCLFPQSTTRPRRRLALSASLATSPATTLTRSTSP